MRLLGAAAAAAIALASQEARASSFVVIGAPAKARSLVTIGEPTGREPAVVMAPDETVRTAALPESASRTETATTPFEVAALVPDWPPPLSRSMVARGARLASGPRTRPAAEHRTQPLPMVMRGGMFGDAAPKAAPTMPTPAVAAPEAPPVEPASRTEISERRVIQPQDDAPAAPQLEPAAPPPAPTPPPGPTRLPE